MAQTPMKKACLVVRRVYNKNQIFDKDSYLNRDQLQQFYIDLQDEFKKRGVDLQTHDCTSKAEADFVIYNEMPYLLPKSSEKNKSFLIMLECDLIRPDNWNLSKHKAFRKVFTWHTELLKADGYFPLNFAHSGQVPFLKFSEKKGFCTLIASYKSAQHPLELYSKRIEAIRWFEKHAPEDFEFYGMGWDRHTFTTPILSKFLNRLGPLRRALALKWPSYKGPLKSKLQTLSQYKFSICYETGRDIPGYITEKAFDSMAAGCIPVYWGSPTFRERVPSPCYVDFTQFRDYQALYNYLKAMTEEEYTERQQAILTYLSSEAHELYRPRPNARAVVERVLEL